ncbi:MAG: UDP-N-acetylmuramoyl-L-alanine--D-glutamate ligase [Bacteroidetes bacterium]|nr:UDP-N-acetylmuramoyl-L-alanine--D-glutamate ligase [Rhodothermia bacterium]MCS7155866.1 UDP-N-acetylmuramoyl-L-alanine--D-glutamate ligase [Bacteroidota bacterium]MCX7906033.1 UDP-N-acetylmuramoyl-L-alanine--D-glutamate ligase [Bacteroidota bacterium]MDW8138161.1 UDP-N-acetylmuramoyl-L-alanine--D-glutamate ligase [Bacteroidota bacterium]MDW8285845.1 UDP-N-acetylmuramoyl-L-alanine--D-glutamate ligase [Bacteroidota bacterium]
MPPLQPIRGQRVTIIGGARSGRAAAELLHRLGAEVFVTDQGLLPQPTREALLRQGISYEEGGHSERALEADWAVISPGVPTEAPLVQALLERGLPLYSELELASWFCPAPIVAITGTNGKTTTTALIGHIFRRSGRPTVVAGNIGAPFSDFVLRLSPEHMVVLEVSSFQLDHVLSFRPHVAAILNISPDHLDRYGGSFARYAEAKFRIAAHQTPQDFLLYNADDPVVGPFGVDPHTPVQARRLGFSLERELPEGAFLRGRELVVRVDQQEWGIAMEHLNLRGRHNLYNSLAAALAARVMEIRQDVVRESFQTFEGVPHRLEFVRQLDGVLYVNDSKATNVNSVWYALESFEQPIVLIMGGRDKGNDYSKIKPLVARKVRVLITIGESAHKIEQELGGLVELLVPARSLEDAVRSARALARPGEVVLLSPACASFDMFENYEHRGDTFKRLVLALE